MGDTVRWLEVNDRRGRDDENLEENGDDNSLNQS